MYKKKSHKNSMNHGKMNSISIANISMNDERSTDAQEEYSHNNSIIAPYKTSNTFN